MQNESELKQNESELKQNESELKQNIQFTNSSYASFLELHFVENPIKIDLTPLLFQKRQLFSDVHNLIKYKENSLQVYLPNPKLNIIVSSGSFCLITSHFQRMYACMFTCPYLSCHVLSCLVLFCLVFVRVANVESVPCVKPDDDSETFMIILLESLLLLKKMQGANEVT